MIKRNNFLYNKLSCSIVYFNILYSVNNCIINYLVAEDTEDELAGVIQFIDEFQNRYGDMRPQFFLGTLDQAIKIACFKPAKDVSIIIIFMIKGKNLVYNQLTSNYILLNKIALFL